MTYAQQVSNLGNRGLRALHALVSSRAVVVHVVRAKAVHLVLGRDREPTATASDKPGERECVPMWLRCLGSTDHAAHALELLHGDHWGVPPRIETTVPEEVAGIERVLEDFV